MVPLIKARKFKTMAKKYCLKITQEYVRVNWNLCMTLCANILLRRKVISCFLDKYITDLGHVNVFRINTGDGIFPKRLILTWMSG